MSSVIGAVQGVFGADTGGGPIVIGRVEGKVKGSPSAQSFESNVSFWR